MDTINLPHQSELEHHLGRFRRQLRWRDGISLAQKTAWVPVLVALSLQLVGRFLPIQNLLNWVLVPFPLWLVGCLGVSLFRRMPDLTVARQVDKELELRERLGTAYLFSEKAAALPESSSQPTSLQSDLVIRQRQDALSRARTIDSRQAFLPRWYPRYLAAFITLAICLAILTLIPNPMDDIIAERNAIHQAASQQAEAIERLREEIAENETISPELQEELLRQLAELAAQLRANPGDLAEALADLSKVEEALRAQLDPQIDLRQSTLEALAAQLQSMAQTGTGQTPDLTEAAQALNQLAEMMKEMSPDEQENLAQALAQMAARASQAGDASLAQALASLAGAVQSGDSQAASQAASQAGEAFSQAQRDFSNQASLQQALSGLQQSRQALGQAAQGRSMARANGPGQADSSGDGDENGEENANGLGQGQGQPGGGGGTTADSLPPATSQGSAGRPQGEGQSGGEAPLGEQVYAPWERRPDDGQEIFIPGEDTDQGSTQVRERPEPLPGSPGSALMPYYEVYYTYLDAANQAIEQSFIPSGLKEYVREYFSNLEP